MRIVIDLQGCQTESRFRGIGRYSLSLAEEMVRQAGSHDVWLCLNGQMDDSLASVHRAFDGLLPRSRIVTFQSLSPVAWPDTRNAWRRNVAENIRETFIQGLQPDIVHVSSLFEGAQDQAVLSIAKFGQGAPTAVTLYDLIPLLNQEAYLGTDWTHAWYMDRVDSLQRADLLLSISQHARSEAIEALGIDATKIVNISSAISPIFQPRPVTGADREALRTRYGISGPFLMYSGAMESRKNLDRLFEALGLLPQSLRERYQLVIAGKVSEHDRARLAQLVPSGMAQDRIVFTGYVTDDELITLYNTCSLYVFPSLHEGFGLPALEAMACGAPTVGSGTTSVPEVIGRTDALFDPTDPASIASVVGRALEDQTFNRSLRDHAPIQASRFSWKASARRALDAFEEIGARQAARNRAWTVVSQDLQQRYRDLIASAGDTLRKVPGMAEDELPQIAECISVNRRTVEHVARAIGLPERLSWRIEGPFDSSYSLALLNRETARAMDGLGWRVALKSTEGPGDFEPSPEFLAQWPDIARLHRRIGSLPAQDADVSSRNLYPPRVSGMESRVNMLHHYAWEESGFPADWVSDFNRDLQLMTCLSTHVEKIMIDNGVAVPLSVSSCGVDHWERIEPAADYVAPGAGFRFLHVSSCFPRKGVDALLKAYGAAFTEQDDVSLVIKTFANPHNLIWEWLKKARSGNPRYPRVEVIESDLNEAELKGLYEQCDALVAPSRAEGFGLPIAEAMLSGLPVITTGWGGQLDFCNEETAWLVDYSFAPAQTHFNLHNSVWAEPCIDSLARQMKHVRSMDRDVRAERPQKGRKLLLQEFTWEKTVLRLEAGVRRLGVEMPDAADSIGWVTTWNTKCGIAAYSQNLIDHTPRRVMVFAPQAPDSAKIEPDQDSCTRCWEAGEQDQLDSLSAAIADSGVRTVVIQFQYSFFNFEHLDRFIRRQTAEGRIVVMMMHATKDAPEIPHRKLANLVGALALCHRVLVHSVADLNRLKSLGVIDNVALFPHGVIEFPAVARDAPNEAFTIATYGYFLPHKGLLEMIECVGKLVEEGRNVKLRMLNAEYPVDVSREQVATARRMISAAGLESRIELTAEFMEDHETLDRLSGADLVVFPYQATGESSSAAVRHGIASGTPVAVTPLAIFDDVSRAVSYLPGTSATEIADGISTLMEQIQRKAPEVQLLRESAAGWRRAHSYEALGRRLDSLLLQMERRAISQGPKPPALPTK